MPKMFNPIKLCALLFVILSILLASQTLSGEAPSRFNQSSASVLVDGNELNQEQANSRWPRRVKANKTTALTSEQWTELVVCKSSSDGHKQDSYEEFSGSSLDQPFRLPPGNFWHQLLSECEVDNNAWRYKYLDELRPSFNYRVRDKTLDERYANIIHTISIGNLYDRSFHTFNSGKGLDEDTRNEQRVAGAKVNDTKCLEELETMSNLYDDMLDTLARFRSGSDLTTTSQASGSLEEHHIRLARVLDSFGRYESGSLDGKIFLAGSYQECIGSQLLVTSQGQRDDDDGARMIQMRYCWANMNIQRHLNPMLKRRRRFRHETGTTALKVAVCLPQSCHSKSLHQTETISIVQRLIDGQLRLPDSIYVNKELQLDSVFCLVDGDSEWGRISTSGRLFMLFIGCWSLLCIGATVANRLYGLRMANGGDSGKIEQEDKLVVVVRSLDLGQSWRELISDKRQVDAGAAVNLDVLNPVKFFGCCFCVLAHVALIMGSHSTNEVQTFTELDKGPLLMASLLIAAVVDTFFVMSGMLVTYISLRKLAKRVSAAAQLPPSEIIAKKSNSSQALTMFTNNDTQRKVMVRGSRMSLGFIGQWFVMSLIRYCRIVPIYALAFWFRRDLFSHLGEGPFWDHGLNRDTQNGACQEEPWYMPFTFLSAFRPVPTLCLPPSWSISHDLLYALVTPPLIMAFLSKPRLAIGCNVSFALASTLAWFYALASEFRPSVLELLNMRLKGMIIFFIDLGPLYSWPFYRASSMLIGMLAGYCLFKYEQRHEYASDTTGNNRMITFGRVGWPIWLTRWATLFAIVCLIGHGICCVFINQLIVYIAPYQRLFAIYLLNVDRVVWSLANAVLFLQMVTNWRHSSWMRNFSSQLWRTLAKLSFVTLFVHWIIILFFIGSIQTQPLPTLWNIFAAYSVILAVSFAISVPVQVMLENPIDKLVKLIAP
uniref:Nose resistant to fluoxetine protein 6 n=1 Tax=Aceria tosichella TaxID=561515 RepID=A0A6G1SMD3_9ACAR